MTIETESPLERFGADDTHNFGDDYRLLGIVLVRVVALALWMFLFPPTLFFVLFQTILSDATLQHNKTLRRKQTGKIRPRGGGSRSIIGFAFCATITSSLIFHSTLGPHPGVNGKRFSHQRKFNVPNNESSKT